MVYYRSFNLFTKDGILYIALSSSDYFILPKCDSAEDKKGFQYSLLVVWYT